jgi:hypothetical protein
VLVERNAKKYQYVGIPAMAITCNIAWEFVWSTFFVTNLGMMFEWGIRAWLLFDLLLLYRLWQYGKKQVEDPWLQKNFHLLVVIGIAGFAWLIYGFVHDFSDPIGAVTGSMANLMMSLMFIGNFLRQPEQKAYSLDIAILKMFGTNFIVIAMFLGGTNPPYLTALGVLIFLTDLVYTLLVWNREKIIAARAAYKTKP